MLKGSNVLTKDVSRIQRLLLSLRARDSLRLIAVVRLHSIALCITFFHSTRWLLYLHLPQPDSVSAI